MCENLWQRNVSMAAASASSANRKQVRISGWPIGAEIPGVAYLALAGSSGPCF